MPSGVYERNPDKLCQGKANGQCQNHALIGQRVCRFHGGDAFESKVVQVMARFGDKMDIGPGEALLDLVQHKAAEVYYWRARVMEMEDLIGDAVLGLQTTKEVDKPGTLTSMGGVEVTQEVVEHIAYRTMRQAERDLAVYCTAAMRAGVEERAVRVAEALGMQMLGALEQFVEAIDLTPAQMAQAHVIIPGILRGLSAPEVPLRP